ncbi:hypothetical protein ALC56_09149 [Trachymyrmex septentrionalis]|uniref:Uncharacterized protein n=1 Tax=Trachymyrmex septentrionalis TaxID=34720 RepID=A0A151JUF8_9HYME|nr:hypothetical protein ALC56_09149 [Trachymyrmex septentrionalis]
MQEPTMSTVQSVQTKQSPVCRRYHQYKFVDRQDGRSLVLVVPQEEQNKVEKFPTENVEKLDKDSHADSIYRFADRKR